MKISTRKSKTSAFTLVELIVVVTIIGILAAIATPRYLDSVARAQTNKQRAVVAEVEKAKDAYVLARAQTGLAYPATDTFNDIANTVANADLKLDKLAPYLSQVVAGGSLTAASLIKGTGRTGILLGTVESGTGAITTARTAAAFQ